MLPNPTVANVGAAKATSCATLEGDALPLSELRRVGLLVAAVAFTNVTGRDALLSMTAGVSVTLLTQVTVGASGWHGWGPAPLGLAASAGAFAVSYLARSWA